MRCPRCHEPNNVGAKSCRKCFKILDDASDTYNPQQSNYPEPNMDDFHPSNQKNSGSFVLILLVALLIVIILGLGILILSRNNNSSTSPGGSGSSSKSKTSSATSSSEKTTSKKTGSKKSSSKKTSSKKSSSEASSSETGAGFDEDAHKGIHEYVFINKDCTWGEAFQYARDVEPGRSYLCHIDSREEYEYLRNHMDNMDDGAKYYWVGATRSSESNQEYRWIYVDDSGDQNSQGTYIGSDDLETASWLRDIWLENEPSYRDNTTDIDETSLVLMNMSDGSWVLNDVADDVISEASYLSGKVGFIIEIERE